VTKRISIKCEPDPELQRMLEKVKGYVMSPEEKAAQRMSWVVGEMMLQDENLTREEAVERYKKVIGE